MINSTSSLYTHVHKSGYVKATVQLKSRIRCIARHSTYPNAATLFFYLFTMALFYIFKKWLSGTEL